MKQKLCTDNLIMKVESFRGVIEGQSVTKTEITLFSAYQIQLFQSNLKHILKL